jgi:hypothetical protein
VFRIIFYQRCSAGRVPFRRSSAGCSIQAMLENQTWETFLQIIGVFTVPFRVQLDRPGTISVRKSSEGLIHTKLHFQAVFSMFSHKHSAGKSHTCTLYTVQYIFMYEIFLFCTPIVFVPILTYAFEMST